MNAPDRNLRISLAPGVYVLRVVSAKTRAGVRQAAESLLTAMRRTRDDRAGKSGRHYLKEVRAARIASVTQVPIKLTEEVFPQKSPRSA